MIASDCDAVRESAFDYRHGELTMNDAEALRTHLDGCDDCAAYFARLDDLLDAPAALAHEATASIEFDALFDRISASIDAEPAASHSAQTPVVLSDSAIRRSQVPTLTLVDVRPDTDDGPQHSVPELVAQHTPVDVRAPEFSEPTPASMGWVVALAALLSAALAFGLWQAATDGTGPSDPSMDAIVATAELDAASTGAATPLELPQHETPSLAIDIRASQDATWEVEHASNQQFTLKVLTGEVLVEFLPMGDTALTVTAGDLEFDVVGTVFVVTHNNAKPTVEVLLGEVAVRSDRNAEGLPVRASEQFQDDEVSAIASERFETMVASVDLEMHEARLEILRALQNGGDEREESPPRRGPTAADRPQPVRLNNPMLTRPRLPARTTDPAIERATAAMEDRRWADAAEAYEEVIRDGAGTGAIRLDLARLYSRRLDTPARAIPHLRTFVLDNPGDPTVDSALRELCRLSTREHLDEPLCR